MHIILRTFLVCLFVSCSVASAQTISNYEHYFGIGIENNQPDTLIIIRHFERGSGGCFFAINPKTCLTHFVPAESLVVHPIPLCKVLELLAHTPYGAILIHAYQSPHSLALAGMQSVPSPYGSFFLTVDLCPSHKSLDRILFKTLVSLPQAQKRPIPCALSVAGRWLENHQDDAAWIDSLIVNEKIEVTWVNHSYNHYAKKDLPLQQNFLLEKGTNIHAEVLKNEQAMIARGWVPSIFFRFPGLISNTAIFDSIIQLGLVPLGTNAWLAKGQIAQTGSVILIHANGNEKQGVREFIHVLNTCPSYESSKDWELENLPRALSRAYGKVSFGQLK